VSLFLKITGAVCAGALVVLGVGVARQYSKQAEERALRQKRWDAVHSVSADELLRRCGQPWLDRIIRENRNGSRERRIRYQFIYDGDEFRMSLDRYPKWNDTALYLSFDFKQAKNESEWKNVGVIENSRIAEPEDVLRLMPCLK